MKCALTAEVSLSNPATLSLSEIAEINSLRQELAAMRMATAGAPQNRRPVGNWSQNRARLGASAGGSLPSSSRPSAPPPPGQSDPNVSNFRQIGYVVIGYIATSAASGGSTKATNVDTHRRR